MESQSYHDVLLLSSHYIDLSFMLLRLFYITLYEWKVIQLQIVDCFL